MAATAFRSVGAAAPGFGTAINVPVPSGVAADDIIITVLYIQSTTSTVTAPDGTWTAAPGSPFANSGGGIREWVWWKRATGTASGTYAFTNSAAVDYVACASRWGGCVTSGSPFDVTTTATAQATAYPNVSVTTTVANTTLVWAAVSYDGASHGGVTTPPANMTTRALYATQETVALSETTQDPTGLSATFSATSTGTDKKNVWLGALIPAATSSPGAFLRMF